MPERIVDCFEAIQPDKILPLSRNVFLLGTNGNGLYILDYSSGTCAAASGQLSNATIFELVFSLSLPQT